MRIILDTVVFARGLINPLSQCGRLIFEYADAYELVASPQIVAEYLDVLHRPKLARKYRAIAGRSLTTVLAIIANATVVHPTHTPAVRRDPEDDKFLATAEASAARYLVTEDAGLLVIQVYGTTQICTAHTMLRHLSEHMSEQS